MSLKNRLLAGLLAAVSAYAAAPFATDGVGVNIHFTDPRPGEMEMLAAGGFRWVRMDFHWASIEKEKGVYDFSAYEQLLAALKPHGIRALFILDYTNKFYDDDLPPHTEEGRQAFARFAAAAVKHFQDKGILWEMWNEPNIKQFWKPAPNAEDYSKLALVVGKAIRAAAPRERYIGPATSRIDMPFLEACFKAGLLKYWDAVSVHPYRRFDPESTAEEYAKLRAMIARYAPKGKTIPIYSGEWGYSDVAADLSVDLQGQYLARQWLHNIACGVPLSIWYDWHDDGADAKEREHHFGTVFFPYFAGRTLVHDPKPAYNAARRLTSELVGYRFARRLKVGAADDYVLEFACGKQKKLACWTRAASPHTVALAGGRSLTLTDEPRYELIK
ncbi:MAG: cellulase family glycosylhydrolase [Acidobacteriales bacterium]|nr:cellulase family glycosylhydrolase [Terriglobales bacterium]